MIVMCLFCLTFSEPADVGGQIARVSRTVGSARSGGRVSLGRADRLSGEWTGRAARAGGRTGLVDGRKNGHEVVHAVLAALLVVRLHCRRRVCEAVLRMRSRIRSATLGPAAGK